MPKLNAATAKKVAAAESTGGGVLLEDGVYRGKLKSVEIKNGPQGPYWSWCFRIEGGKGQQWVNTSLSESSAWKMKEVFEAFGVPADTDTDLLLGKVVKLVVSQRTIQKGSRMGEMGNQVDRVRAEDWDPDAEEETATEEAAAPVAAAANGRGRKAAAAPDDDDF